MSKTINIETNAHNLSYDASGVKTLDQNVSVTVSKVIEDSDIQQKTLDPLHWKKIADGVTFPVLPYTRTITKGSVMLDLDWRFVQKYKSSKRANYATGRTTLDGASSYLYLPSTLHTKYATGQNQAIQTAKGNFSKHVANVILDLPTELGEIRESGHMFMNRVNNLVDFASTFFIRTQKLRREARRLVFTSSGQKVKFLARNAVAAINNLNQMYLEWNYGWKPLMNSFDQVSQVLREQMAPVHARSKVSGKGYFTSEIIDKQLGSFPNIHGYCKPYINIHTDYRFDAWFGGLLLVEEQVGLRKKLGLESSNILPSLWELTYLSFIADYFTNIGDYIANLRNAGSAMKPDSLYLSTREHIKQYCVFDHMDVLHQDPAGTTEQAYGTGHTSSSFDYVDFRRIAQSAGNANVSLILKSPSGLQLFKTLSVALAVTGTLSKVRHSI